MHKVKMGPRIIFLILLLIFSVPIFAEIDMTNFIVPYKSYTFDYWDEPMPAPQPFLPDKIINLSSIGVEGFSSPRDIYVSKRNNIYVVDSNSGKIISFDQDWNLLNIIDGFENEGQIDKLSSPSGIFVDHEENVYVADTGNKRVVHLSPEGELVKIIGYPEPEVDGILPDNFDYKPIKVAADRSGRLYVLSEDTYEGILQFDRMGQFQGFIGAPRVKPSLWDRFWKWFATEEQRDRRAYFLPTEYSNIDIDERGFIYATIPSGDRVEDEAIRKLNPSGEDVLRRNGFHNPVGDIDYPTIWEDANITGPSVFVDIAVQDYDIYNVLDRNRGRVFTYDNNGYLLYTFGYRLEKYGALVSPVAIDTLDKNILILDNRKNSIVVYRPTDYAVSILAAIEYHYKGNYDKSTEMWEKVLKYNANNDLAYTGLGRAAMRLDDFATAMEYFKLGNNRRDYSDALSYYRKEVIGRNFNKIMAGLLLLIILVIVLKKLRQKGVFARLIAKTRWQEKPILVKLKSVYDSVRYSRHLIYHPFDGFWDLKHEKRGNVPAATVLLILVCLTYVFIRQYTGFIYNPYDLTELNIVSEFLSILVPFLLWCVVNWSLTTLVEGKGTFRDIYIASAYALTPIILINIPLTIVSNFMTIEESAFYDFFFLAAIFWAGFLVYFGIMVTHRFEGGKNFLTVVLTIAGMLFVIFISILFFNLAEQFYTFVREIYLEVVYRL